MAETAVKPEEDILCRRCAGMVPQHLHKLKMCVPCDRDIEDFATLSGVHARPACDVCREPLRTMSEIHDRMHPHCREFGSPLSRKQASDQ